MILGRFIIKEGAHSSCDGKCVGREYQPEKFISDGGYFGKVIGMSCCYSGCYFYENELDKINDKELI